MEAEHRYEPENKVHQCPECGRILFHHLSRRCRNSYIKNKPVQQDVEADLDRAALREYLHAERPPTFFLAVHGPLNSALAEA